MPVNAGTGTPMDSVVGGLSYALQYLAVCVLLILSLVKSGAWARDVMGGWGGARGFERPDHTEKPRAARTPVPPFFGAPCPNRCLSRLGVGRRARGPFPGRRAFCLRARRPSDEAGRTARPNRF